MRHLLSSISKFPIVMACTVLLPCYTVLAAPETAGSRISAASGTSAAGPSASVAPEVAPPNAASPPAASASVSATTTKALPTASVPTAAAPTNGAPKATPDRPAPGKPGNAATVPDTPNPATRPEAETAPTLEVVSGNPQAPTAATQATTMHVVGVAPPRASADGPKALVVPAKPLPPEAPVAAYFDVGVVVQTNWNTNRAYDFFSDNDLLPKGGLVIGVDVARSGAALFAIDVNALFTGTSSEGPLPNYISKGEMSETDLGAGLTLRYDLWSWLAPQARVGGGVALQDTLLLSPDFGDLRRKFTTGYLTLGGGIALTTPSQRLHRTRSYLNSLGLRIMVEGGYHLGQELEFSVKAKPINDSDAPNPIAQTTLGVLPQSGPYLRVSVHARF